MGEEDAAAASNQQARSLLVFALCPLQLRREVSWSSGREIWGQKIWVLRVKTKVL